MVLSDPIAPLPEYHWNAIVDKNEWLEFEQEPIRPICKSSFWRIPTVLKLTWGLAKRRREEEEEEEEEEEDDEDEDDEDEKMTKNETTMTTTTDLGIWETPPAAAATRERAAVACAAIKKIIKTMIKPMLKLKLKRNPKDVQSSEKS
ncbi:hypothetical protein FPSE_10936 [Fusarium pseudograminearum CS3096]|uniref:Uncharacterized protein n=1 Tax=Fusarium pseudograminearum (strain CS3096) TaxID=1028729 RepID=K3V6Z6_FUSPC|nr:hypothetical protein FPSE_10936 [Fusarium pseudograminearum CS3096]EKJ68874.1 hypothetical protein FPSE_10936 [Fusarium pseudograminearum CS3096]KAF0635654.1 hypothetical protein FPSE5266_10936 [Fusarium pseudograminearum]